MGWSDWERREAAINKDFFAWVQKATDEDLKHVWYTAEWRGRQLRTWMRDALLREARLREQEKQETTWPHEAELRLYGLMSYADDVEPTRDEAKRSQATA